jgi:hypothetical protein
MTGSDEPTSPEETAPASPAVPPAPVGPRPRPAPRRRAGPVAIAAVVVLALLGGGIGIGVALSGGSTARPSGRSSGRTSPGAGPVRVVSVSATPASPIEVDLSWQASGVVQSFSIYRNGTLLTTDPGSVTSYTDANASPNRTYTYAVAAADAAGRASAQVSTAATTPGPPPLSQARLEGEFLVKAMFTQENYTNFSVGQTEKLTWRFRPVCDSGPCNVKIDIFAPAEHFKPLRHKGSTYTGKGTARLGKCGSSTLTSTITILVRVSKARYVADVWTATALTGTLKEYSPPTFSCQSGSSSERLDATFRGL